MKIHLEFNNMAEMYSYCKTIMFNATVQTPEPPKPVKPNKDQDNWQGKYEITLANLERAYERIRMLDPTGQTANVSAKDIAKRFESICEESILSLDLPMRALNCLTAENIKTVGELMKKTPYELRKIPNLGKVSLKDIEEALYDKYKLHLKEGV